MASDFTDALAAMFRCWASQIRQSNGDYDTLMLLADEIEVSAGDLAKAEALLIDESVWGMFPLDTQQENLK